jgi:hypothetical protein
MTCQNCRTFDLFYYMQPPTDLLPEKKTWRGCGLHVPAVMNAIPREQWCTCIPKTTVGEDEFPPKITQGQPPRDIEG